MPKVWYYAPHNAHVITRSQTHTCEDHCICRDIGNSDGVQEHCDLGSCRSTPAINPHTSCPAGFDPTYMLDDTCTWCDNRSDYAPGPASDDLSNTCLDDHQTASTAPHGHRTSNRPISGPSPLKGLIPSVVHDVFEETESMSSWCGESVLSAPVDNGDTSPLPLCFAIETAASL